jgi:hypothetical protein
MGTIPRVAADTLLLDLTAAAAALDGCHVHLIAAPVVPGDATQLADLTEASFNGYAPSAAIVWNVPVNDPNGGMLVDAPGFQFLATDGLVPNLLYGYWIQQDRAGPPATHKLISITLFPTPVAIGAANDGVFVVPTFHAPQSA